MKIFCQPGPLAVASSLTDAAFRQTDGVALPMSCQTNVEQLVPFIRCHGHENWGSVARTHALDLEAHVSSSFLRARHCSCGMVHKFATMRRAVAESPDAYFTNVMLPLTGNCLLSGVVYVPYKARQIWKAASSKSADVNLCHSPLFCKTGVS